MGIDVLNCLFPYRFMRRLPWVVSLFFFTQTVLVHPKRSLTYTHRGTCFVSMSSSQRRIDGAERDGGVVCTVALHDMASESVLADEAGASRKHGASSSSDGIVAKRAKCQHGRGTLHGQKESG
jgi:hypothetical protein